MWEKAYLAFKKAPSAANPIAETLIQTTPLIFTALSYAIALRLRPARKPGHLEGSYT